MLKTIDLFAGAGGLSLGFKQTGRFKLVAAAEIKESARETYRCNIPDDQGPFEFIDNVVGFDFKALNERMGGIDVVIGGPPCQGFSNANRHKIRLVSMNNALVKEYFRAILEIKPSVFVMENVSMLKSSVHRFYDSARDHDIITRLNDSASAEEQRVRMREDEYIVAEHGYEGFDLLDIAQNSEHLKLVMLPEKLFHLLYVLYKNKDNTRRLPTYLEKHGKEIIKKIDEYCRTAGELHEDVQTSCRWLKLIKAAIKNGGEIDGVEELTAIVELQECFRTIAEVNDNQLIGSFSNQNGALVFKIRSYAVIDYVNAILGGNYVQHGATLNAAHFGVPQERMRHIVIGVRKDLLGDRDFQMIEDPKQYDTVTVWDAISDLEPYTVSKTSDCPAIPYSPGDDGLSAYAAEMRRDSSSVKNHYVTDTSETAKKRFEKIEVGKNFLSLPSELKDTYSNPERTQKTIYLRLNPNQPSGTVVNVRKSMWIHPTLNRAVSLREAARLQSFPDWFEFRGSKDAQYQQVGNAVPPLLAKSIAKYVMQLHDTKVIREDSNSGQ